MSFNRRREMALPTLESILSSLTFKLTHTLHFLYLPFSFSPLSLCVPSFHYIFLAFHVCLTLSFSWWKICTLFFLSLCLLYSLFHSLCFILCVSHSLAISLSLSVFLSLFLSLSLCSRLFHTLFFSFCLFISVSFPLCLSSSLSLTFL